VQEVVSVTTSLVPFLPHGTVRRVLWWRYDDDEATTSADDAAVDVVPRVLTFGGAFVPFAGNTEDDVEPRRPANDVVGSLASLAAERTRGHIREYKAALADFIYTTSSATYHLEIKSAVGEVGSVVSQARMDSAELVRMFDPQSIATLMEGYRDFYSSALTDLTQVSLTIESINNTLRETMRSFMSAYVRDHGYAYGVEDESDSTGLAFTDDAADYPPTPRNYTNVKVRVSGSDRIKPRRYSDEDHQVWGDVALDDD
jgi:hypothetical protein